jgi:protein O-mannosyl-transferase
MPDRSRNNSTAKSSVIGARWRTIAPALILLALPWVVFLPSVSGPFLFDDLSGIRDNPAVQNLDHVPEMIRFWEPSAVSYRPLRYFSYALDWVRGDGSARVFHETNLLLHGLGGLLLFVLLRRLLAQSQLAFWAALLWLIHPMQVDAVAYISGRKDLLCTLFYLLALLGVIARSRADRTVGRLSGSALFYVAALLSFLSKEMALTLPLAALLVDLHLASASTGSWRRRLGDVLRRGRVFYGLMLIAGTSALVYKLIIAPGTKLPFDLLRDPIRNIPLALQTFSFFLRKAICPWPLVADLRGLFPTALADGNGWGFFWNGGGVLATLFGWLSVLFFVIVARRSEAELRGPILGGLILFGVALLPVANLIPLNEPAAEHYSHLPFAALSVVMVSVACSVWRRWSIPTGRGRIGAAVLLALLAGSSGLRSTVWRDDATLWRSVMAVHEGSDRAWNNLGLVLLAEGNRPAAQRAFARSLDVGSSPLRQTVANLVQMYRTDGQLDAALRTGQLGLQHFTDDPLLLGLTGGVLVSLRQGPQARELLERVAALSGGVQAAPQSWPRDRALAHSLCGDVERGEALLREAAILQPDEPSIPTSLGSMLLTQGRIDEALAVLEPAVRLPGASGIAFRNLAVALYRLNRFGESADALNEAERRGDSVPPSLRQAVNEAVSRPGTD